MSTCEKVETVLTALIDGELDAIDAVAAVDHLVRCPACQGFYEKARSLDEVSLEVMARSSGPVSEEVWQRIESDESIREGEPAPRRRWPVWGSVAATLALALFGTWIVLQTPDAVPATTEDPSYVEVVLGQDGGRMTEDRFVELTKELLEADSRYHYKMREVMDLVAQEAPGSEGSGEWLEGRGEAEGVLEAGDETPEAEGFGSLGLTRDWMGRGTAL